jgi:hypothetical protein
VSRASACITPADLRTIYGDGWRFTRYGTTWVGVRDDGTRFEASDPVTLCGRIARGESVS